MAVAYGGGAVRHLYFRFVDDVNWPYGASCMCSDSPNRREDGVTAKLLHRSNRILLTAN